MVAKFEVEDDEHTLQDEELAEAFLDAGDFSWQAVEELLDGLWLSDIVVPNRRKGAFEPSSFISVHVAGMFRHGGVVGATNWVRRRPALTKLLVEAMKRHLPAPATFSTLSLNFNNPMQCHRDSNNQVGEKAYLVGLGSYCGGDLRRADVGFREPLSPHTPQPCDLCPSSPTPTSLLGRYSLYLDSLHRGVFGQLFLPRS